MKDLYSFHTSEKDLFAYYEQVKGDYINVFKRCGLETLYTLAAGGDFTLSNTHEFQVLADVGEDTILYCKKCQYAENSEISKLKKGSVCPECSGVMLEASAIEVANIFPLGTRYAEALNLRFKDKNGKAHPVVMGSYGIGVSRLMATIVEVHHDNKGIMWPEPVAPYSVHLIALQDSDAVRTDADKIYESLLASGTDVLYDDRSDTSPGEKFADADLFGIPLRVTLSEKSLDGGGVELKKRNEKKMQIVSVKEFLNNDQ